MSVSRAFDQAKAEKRAALIGYLPAGFPDVDGAVEAMRTMVEAGVDIVEIGLPYSDPVMDGPTIQAAAQQALEGGIRTSDVLRTVEAVAATGVPTVGPRCLRPARERSQLRDHSVRFDRSWCWW